MERSDNTVRSGADEPAIASSRFPTSAALVAAIRRGESAAIRELFILYAPLLRDQARLMGIDRGDENEFVTTLLDDIVIHLIDAEIAPRDLSRYLVASVRNRARNVHRDAKRHDTAFESAYSRVANTGQRVVAESYSEYGMHSAMAESEETPLREAIVKLADKSAAALSEEELKMMIAVSRHMPLREFAAQNGITYANARVRLHRLRTRFTRLAVQYVELLEPGERREIERFFRRAGVPLAGSAEESTKVRSNSRIQRRGNNEHD